MKTRGAERKLGDMRRLRADETARRRAGCRARRPCPVGEVGSIPPPQANISRSWTGADGKSTKGNNAIDDRENGDGITTSSPGSNILVRASVKAGCAGSNE